MRKVFVIAILAGIIILIAHYLSQPKPLRPIVVTWQEIGEVWGFVDLDANDNDELVVRDKDRQLWWVQFSPTVVARQKIPVPKGAYRYWASTPNVVQLLDFEHPQTHQVLLITRHGEKWLTEDLGKSGIVIVKDADQDGQVNDVIVWHGQTRRVFSRMKDGTIIERSNLPDFQADLDGDGKEDAVYVKPVPVYWIVGKVCVRFSSGSKASLMPYLPYIAVIDMDGDKVAEIVGIERRWISSIAAPEYCFHCWRYENGRWRKSLSPKFGGIEWFVDNGDASFGFPPRETDILIRDEKGAYLLAVTKKGRRVKVWEVRWQKDKWTKRLMGEVPKHIAESAYLIVFTRVGQGWIMVGRMLPPVWQCLLWGMVGRHLQRFLPFLRESRGHFFVYGWDGQQKWTLLGRWSNNSVMGFRLADMDGDGEQELVLAFPKRVLVAKFEDGRWRKVWTEVPPFAKYGMIGVGSIRYGGREWALFHQEKRNGSRCVAIALEK